MITHQSLIPIFVFLFGIASTSASLDGMNYTANPCPYYDTVNISSGYKDAKNNFIFNGITFEEGTYAYYDYIIENRTEVVTVEPHFRGCICNYRPCIRICCLYSEGRNEVCMKSQILHVPIHDQEEKIIDITSNEYGILMDRPCTEMFKLEPDDYAYDQWIFLQNGSIEVNNEKVSNTSTYCFGQSQNKSTGNIVTEVMMCNIQDNIDLRYNIYPIGMIISMPFLIMTFFVYAFIPELRNLHGKCLMCYVFSLMALYISLTIVQLNRNRSYAETFECYFLGYSIHISVFLCFFWLNVMCIDIWSTFRGGISRGRGFESKRFLLYSMYAFGCPIILTTIVFCIDTFKLFKEKYLPRIGAESCYVHRDHTVQTIYVYTPVSIIIFVNIVLYSITAFRIWKVQKETSVIRNGDSQKHSKMEADTDRFFLYLRLFIIMGVMWSMESISFLFNNDILFYVSDFLNCLQGLIIFLLFVWKPKVKKLIIRRYRSLRNLPPTMSQNSATETSRISSMAHRNVPSSLSEKPMLRD